MTANDLVRLIYEYGNVASRDFYANFPDFVARRQERQKRGDTKLEATLATIVELAEEITEQSA